MCCNFLMCTTFLVYQDLLESIFGKQRMRGGHCDNVLTFIKGTALLMVQGSIALKPVCGSCKRRRKRNMSRSRIHTCNLLHTKGYYVCSVVVSSAMAESCVEEASLNCDCRSLFSNIYCIRRGSQSSMSMLWKNTTSLLVQLIWLCETLHNLHFLSDWEFSDDAIMSCSLHNNVLSKACLASLPASLLTRCQSHLRS